MTEFGEKIRQVGVIPIVSPKSVASGLEIAGAVAEGGATAIEIVLRTPEALAAITAIAKAFPALMVGAGTILSAEQYRQAADAGAYFGISPGFDAGLLAEVASGPMPFVPGVQTATEIIAARAAGIKLLKFYPSEPAGGVTVLRDFGSIFSDVLFMPSGKVSLSVLPQYALLRNVVSVGGTWMLSQNNDALDRAGTASRMRQSLDIMRK